MCLRIVSNPVANALQKLLMHRGLNALAVVGATHGLLSLACLPVCLQSAASLSSSFWWCMSACAALAVTSNSLLVQAMKLSDLSILGPINAWKPVVSLLPGLVVLGEAPGFAALCGIALIVAGSHRLAGTSSMSRRSGRSRLLADRGVQLRFVALLLSGVEAVFLKRSLLASTPLIAFAWWSVLGLGACLLGAVIVARSASLIPESPALRRSFGLVGLAALATGLMQGTTLVVLKEYPVGPALALFQTSAVLSVLLGWRVFGEPDIARRMTGAAVMAAGAVVLVLSR